jgi:hypothetical protein
LVPYSGLPLCANDLRRRPAIACCFLRGPYVTLWERDAHLQGVWRSRATSVEDLCLGVRGRIIPEGLQSARATARIQYVYGPSSERVDTLGYQDGSIDTRGREGQVETLWRDR